MANSDTPKGFHAVRLMDGTPYNGGGSPYYIGTGDTVALFPGDPVVMASTANTTEVEVNGGKFPPGTLPHVARATAGATGNILGVVASVLSTDRDSLTYRAASTERVVFVHDHPDLVFEVQEDGVGGALAATNVGQNIDVIFTHAGSTSTGQSGAEIDSNTAGTAATKQFRILRLVNRENNEIGTNAKWEVMVNPTRHQLRIGTGT